MDVSVKTLTSLNPEELIYHSDLSSPVTFKWFAALFTAKQLSKVILPAHVLCNGAFSCCITAEAMHSHHVGLDHQTCGA